MCIMIPFLYKIDDLYAYIQCTEKSGRILKMLTLVMSVDKEGVEDSVLTYILSAVWIL